MTCKISVHWIFRRSHNSVGRRPYFQGLGICWWILKWGQNNQFEEESYELWERKQGEKKLCSIILVGGDGQTLIMIKSIQFFSSFFFFFSFFYFSSTQTLDCDGWEWLALLRRMALSYRLCTYMLLKMGTLSSNLEDDICASILSSMNI